MEKNKSRRQRKKNKQFFNTEKSIIKVHTVSLQKISKQNQIMDENGKTWIVRKLIQCLMLLKQIIKNSLQFISLQCGVIYNFLLKMINNLRKRGSFKVPKRKHEGKDEQIHGKRIVYQMPVNLNLEKIQQALKIECLIQKKSNNLINELKSLKQCKQAIKKDHSNSKYRSRNSLTKKQSLNLFDMEGQTSSQLSRSKSPTSKQKLCENSDIGRTISQNQALYYQEMEEPKNKNMVRNYQEFYGYGYETCSIGLIEEINKIHNYNVQEEMEQIFHRLKIRSDEEFVQQQYRGVIKCDGDFLTQ